MALPLWQQRLVIDMCTCDRDAVAPNKTKTQVCMRVATIKWNAQMTQTALMMTSFKLYPKYQAGWKYFALC